MPARSVSVCYKINTTAGRVNFVADRNAPGWHTEGSENDVIIWKDWTTIGLNVMDYRGKNIKIKLTTYDCQEGAHFGYAYFTMNCIAAELSGIECLPDNRKLSV